jgi:hypothetical protein
MVMISSSATPRVQYRQRRHLSRMDGNVPWDLGDAHCGSLEVQGENVGPWAAHTPVDVSIPAIFPEVATCSTPSLEQRIVRQNCHKRRKTGAKSCGTRVLVRRL